MTNNIKPIYKRIIIKLSGESLQGPDNFGINAIMIDRIANEIKELVSLGIQVGMVIGGGNLFRGAGLAKAGMSRVISDHIGMLATVINGLAIRDAMYRINIDADLMSTIPISSLCNKYSWYEAIRMLKNNSVLILSAGTGNPFFTTDSAACLRGIELEANVVLKATKVDGVYSSDPIKNPNAKLYDQLSYQDVLDQKLEVMDLAAFTLARDNNLPIRVFNINKHGALCRIVMGHKEGTLINNFDIAKQ